MVNQDRATISDALMPPSSTDFGASFFAVFDGLCLVVFNLGFSLECSSEFRFSILLLECSYEVFYFTFSSGPLEQTVAHPSSRGWIVCL